jgi:hypothetical protein
MKQNDQEKKPASETPAQEPLKHVREVPKVTPRRYESPPRPDLPPPRKFKPAKLSPNDISGPPV